MTKIGPVIANHDKLIINSQINRMNPIWLCQKYEPKTHENECDCFYVALAGFRILVQVSCDNDL